HAGEPRHLGAVADDVGETSQTAEMENYGGDDGQRGENQDRKRQWSNQTMLTQVGKPRRESTDGTVLHEQSRQAPESDVTRQCDSQRAQPHNCDEVAVEQTE